MKRFMLSIVFVLVATSLVYAQSPKFDITGIWRSQDPGNAQVFQDGAHVSIIYINKGFSHLFVGRYITPTIVKGIQYRTNRSNGCMTTMALNFYIDSADSMRNDWVAQDSNCDLREGQRGSGSSQRDRKLEDSLWY